MKIQYSRPISEKNVEILSKRIARAQKRLAVSNIVDKIFSPIWMVIFLLCATIATIYGFNTYVGADYVRPIISIPFFKSLIAYGSRTLIAKLPGQSVIKWAIASVFLPGLICLPLSLLFRLLLSAKVSTPINDTSDRNLQAKILYDQAYDLGFTKIKGSKGLWLTLAILTIIGTVGYFFVITSGLLTTHTLEMGDQQTKSLTVCIVAILVNIALAVLSKTFQSFVCGCKTRYDTKQLRKDILNYRIGTDIKHIVNSAIKDHSLSIKYQPVYNINCKKFLSAEALVRLSDKTYGDISPSVFIPAAEKRGIIIPVTNEVIKMVCKFISGLDFENLRLSHININLSVRELMEPSRVPEIIRIVDSYNVEHSKITFEITETAMSISEDIFWANIKMLHDSGFTIALDDFGSGYSTFSRVVNDYISTIKVDVTLVAENENSKAGILLTDITKTLKHQNKELLIEGIETKAQCDFVTKLGFDYIQGYYFSKPVSEENFIEFIKKYNRRD